ncbi:protein SPIRAL1-like 1 [Cornus florida]|uniref:protein SPIRAL1-like 1 n=1 Tax=Cornus florida TaxID=4283 RepID=UPI00289B250D|nr:protein SPIRAL1-like 1 [Cornus florida]
MGCGVSSGGGQSLLGYLFGSGEAPKPVPSNAQAAPNEEQPTAISQPVDVNKQIPARIHSNPANNYFRADGQNNGNFITVSYYFGYNYYNTIELKSSWWSIIFGLTHSGEKKEPIDVEVFVFVPLSV